MHRWSTIARYLPGRTDNEIKNYWRTHFKKREKSSSHKQEKRKAQVLNKKLQLQQQQEQQQQQQLGDDKMKAINFTSEGKIHEAQEKQEMAFMGPDLESQCLPVMYQDIPSWADFMVEDGVLWGGLWNLDDQVDHTSNCSKIAKQNQATAFSFAGGSDNTYSSAGGYIF